MPSQIGNTAQPWRTKSFEQGPGKASYASHEEYLRITILDSIVRIGEAGVAVGLDAANQTPLECEADIKELTDHSDWIRWMVSEAFDHLTTVKGERDQALAENQKLREQLNEAQSYAIQADEDGLTMDRYYQLIEAERNVGVKKLDQVLAMIRAAEDGAVPNDEDQALLNSGKEFVRQQKMLTSKE